MECQFDLSSIDLKEQRKEFRDLIKKYKKTNEIDKLKTVLNQFYSLAVMDAINLTIIYSWADSDDIHLPDIKKVCKKNELLI